MALRDRQLQRERLQRDAALGKRARSVLKGDLGPVLKRWVSGSILPVAGRLRTFAEAALGGDLDGAAACAQSPLFGVPAVGDTSDLDAVLRWTLKGDHADDLVLAVLGTAISTCAVAGKAVPLTSVITNAGGVARETALGQFVTQVQGAKAMQRVRKGSGPAWGQGKKLDAIAALLGGQVRSALDNGMAVDVGGRKVVQVITPEGKERRVDLREPEAADWDLLDVARRVKGERDPHVTTWASFAMLVLCVAQAEAGWFDLVKMKPRDQARAKKHRHAHGLVLSEGAHTQVKLDLDKWMRLGFTYEPMIVEPEMGDYLSVKHREIAGGRGPMGMRTDARGSSAWSVASTVMAGTEWSVAEPTLRAIRESEFIASLAAKSEEDEGRREAILGEYRRLVPERLWFPIFMDFRGRVYSRTNLVTYQGGDLQKSLLCFPQHGASSDFDEHAMQAVVLHASALYGGPDKLDKAAYEARLEWWCGGKVDRAITAAAQGQWEDPSLQDLLSTADEPLQLLTVLALEGSGQGDRIACQIDGTCNGLQHLSALFRDETAAPWVNLCGSTHTVGPNDLYGEVARRVAERLAGRDEPWARRVLASIRLDRKLCKGPVMVLPYGGTRMTIEEQVLHAMLAQEPLNGPWVAGWENGDRLGQAYPDWKDGNYEAFMGRELKDHPLFALDAKRLGSLVWDCIADVLPKPMAAMQAFRDIAKAVGHRSLEWDTGFTWGDEPSLWVVQAKAKSAASGLSFKGFQLPGSVRGLKLRAGRDEVDPRAHTSGIVANFIHSLDATHMVRTMAGLRMEGGESFGAIHDCFITRPSDMRSLKRQTRYAFRHMYEADPLAQPVQTRTPNGNIEVHPSWYSLAKSWGIYFPEKGSWDPAEVVNSAWFFS